MKTPRTRLAFSLAAIAALTAAPAAAATGEEAVVPPSNSAATQYTETFPTTGGDKKTDQKSGHTPAKVLGSRNAQKLEKQGPEGKAAAETAAATAPTSISTPPSASVYEPTVKSNGGGPRGGSGGNRDKGNGGPSGPQHRSDTANEAGTVRPAAPEPAGSSGIGSAIGQATGLSTSGQSGLLLPLVILATILWSLAYFWRQRRQLG